MIAEPTFVSVYVVEQVPSDREQTDWLKLPVPLFEFQVTVPVGIEPLKPDTEAVQVTGWPMETGLGEQTTEVEDC